MTETKQIQKTNNLTSVYVIFMKHSAFSKLSSVKRVLCACMLASTVKCAFFFPLSTDLIMTRNASVAALRFVNASEAKIFQMMNIHG